MNGRSAWGLCLFWVVFAPAPGCAADDDACRDRMETCLSLTLSGSEGVSQADQLQVLLLRMPRPLNPMMRLGKPQDLPFKVAVLWPDGGATISVHSFLSGELNGVTAELAMDIRGGTHMKRALTLYPPLPGKEGMDMATMGRDMRLQRDLSPPPDLGPEVDLSPPADLRVPADLTVPDLATPADLGMPDMADGAGDMTDLLASDLAADSG